MPSARKLADSSGFAGPTVLPPWLPARPGRADPSASPLAWRRPRAAGPALSSAAPALRDVSNRLVADGLAPGGVELALDLPPVRRFATVQVLREDKFVFDALQGWYRAQTGRPVFQWDLFTLLLVEALDHDGDFAPAAG